VGMKHTKVGDRYKYKESSICRVLGEQKDSFGRVFVYWEGEHFVSWVDVESSLYIKEEKQ